MRELRICMETNLTRLHHTLKLRIQYLSMVARLIEWQGFFKGNTLLFDHKIISLATCPQTRVILYVSIPLSLTPPIIIYFYIFLPQHLYIYLCMPCYELFLLHYSVINTNYFSNQRILYLPLYLSFLSNQMVHSFPPL